MIVDIVEGTLVNFTLGSLRVGAFGAFRAVASLLCLRLQTQVQTDEQTQVLQESILFVTPWCAVQHFIFSSRLARPKKNSKSSSQMIQILSFCMDVSFLPTNLVWKGHRKWVEALQSKSHDRGEANSQYFSQLQEIGRVCLKIRDSKKGL